MGVDPRAAVPIYIYDHATVVRALKPGRSSAVNEAAEIACLEGCDVLAFLDDDDRWNRLKSGIMLPFLERAPFVSCSQNVVGETSSTPITDCNDNVVINDYPMPSGWMMTSDLWRKVGGFNLAFRWLSEMEWIGRLNQLRTPRIHLREKPSVLRPRLPRPGKLAHVAVSAFVIETSLPECLVARTANTQGCEATIDRGGVAAAEATAEMTTIRANFGNYFW